jgi:hypothetical protein
MSEEWVTITEAANRLKVRRNKISRLASRGVIETRDNPLDARVRLVNLNELKVLFEKYGNKLEEDKNIEDT